MPQQHCGFSRELFENRDDIVDRLAEFFETLPSRPFFTGTSENRRT
jgi:hypothetical protein